MSYFSSLPKLRSKSVEKLTGLLKPPQKFQIKRKSQFLVSDRCIKTSQNSPGKKTSIQDLSPLSLKIQEVPISLNDKSPGLNQSSQKRIQSMEDLLKKCRDLDQITKYKQVVRRITKVQEGFGKLQKEVKKMQNLDESYTRFVNEWKSNITNNQVRDTTDKELRSCLRIIRKRKLQKKTSAKSYSTNRASLYPN